MYFFFIRDRPNSFEVLKRKQLFNNPMVFPNNFPHRMYHCARMFCVRGWCWRPERRVFHTREAARATLVCKRGWKTGDAMTDAYSLVARQERQRNFTGVAFSNGNTPYYIYVDFIMSRSREKLTYPTSTSSSSFILFSISRLFICLSRPHILRVIKLITPRALLFDWSG